MEIIMIYQKRYTLYRDIYNHKTNHTIEAMVVDFLKETHNVLYEYDKVIYDWEKYIKLDDSIMAQIQFATEDRRLDEARHIINRIH
mmetsp:Transcript_5315/g.4032  ORF Transcript_5315/g.4032 Transcript_5315/m.4032 type:complete len:86 (-) Transcript_5315:435-692(-)